MRKSVARVVALSVLAVCLASSSGCATVSAVQLKKPDNNDILQIGKAPGPQFVWEATTSSGQPAVLGDGQSIDYTLLVSREERFNPAAIVYAVKRIKDVRHMIPRDGRDAGWLPGGASYFWRVDGDLKDRDGNVVRRIATAKPRSFTLEKRELVELMVTVPKREGARGGVSVKIGEDDESSGDFTVKLENGESRSVLYRVTASDGQSFTVGGKLWVVAVNENTRFGRVHVGDNVTAEGLRKISQGDVGEFSYLLGGEEIVKMKLGGRTE